MEKRGAGLIFEQKMLHYKAKYHIRTSRRVPKARDACAELEIEARPASANRNMD